jgi:hypothetical protein
MTPPQKTEPTETSASSATDPQPTSRLFDQVWLDGEAPAGRPDWMVVWTGSCWAAAERSGVKLAMLWDYWRMAVAWCDEMAAPAELGWVQIDDHWGFPMFCGHAKNN